MKKQLTYSILFFLLVMITSCQEKTFEPEVFGSLFGEVLLNSDNTPLENVKISTNPPTSSIFTDDAGRFALENVPTNSYTIRAEKDGLITSVESVTVYENQTANVIIEMVPDTMDSQTPDAPFDPTPASGSIDQPVDLTLFWSSFDLDGDALLFDVILYNSDQTQSMTLASAVPDSMLEVTLEYNTTYFWQVSASDGFNDPVFSEVWSFTTEPFPDHRFLFAREVSGKYEIFSSDEEGTAIQLTDNVNNNWRPIMNRQRTKIAFISDAGIEPQIYIMNRDGSGITQVTTVPISGTNNLELDFCWSPDGTQLLYMNNTNLYRINIDGSGFNLFVEAPPGFYFVECDWTDQNDLIIARTTGADPYNSLIYTFSIAGNYLGQVYSNIPGGTGGPIFSIDGTSFLYTHDISGYQAVDGRQLDATVFIKNINNQAMSDLSGGKPAGTNDLDPRYSPDGSKIIFVNTNNDGISQKNIWTMNLDGSGRTLLFENAEMPDWR